MRWKILLLVLAMMMIAVVASSNNNKSVVHADDTCAVLSAVKSADGATDVTFDCGQGVVLIIHEPVWP